MERLHGMNNWNWEDENKNDEDMNIEQLEQFVNSELVVNGDVFAGHIEKIYNSSFGMVEFINDESNSDIINWNNPALDHIEMIDEGFINASIPTTFLFGQFSEEANFGKLVSTNFIPETDEDEDLISIVERVGKQLSRLSQLLDKDKVDFCIVSYPVVFDAGKDWGEGYNPDKLHLLSIIFTKGGSIGRAFSSRRELTEKEQECDHGHKPVHIQYELPGTDKMILTYRELLKMWKKQNNDNEAMLYTKMIKTFFNTPTIYDKSSMKFELNHLVDNIGETKSLFVGSKDIFHKDIQEDIFSVPSDGFVILEDDVKDYFIDQIKLMLENGEMNESDFENLTRIIKGQSDTHWDEEE